MYILLTGTKKNAGDFLISHAARRLFREFAPDPEHVELPAWEGLDDKLQLVNSAKALILCGGPAYQAGIGKSIYPILSALGRIKVPVIFFGVGWKGIPGDDYDLNHYSIPSYAEPLLDRIRNDFKYAGSRDNLTHSVLRRNGFENATMTGCPVWYDSDYFGKRLTVPPEIKRIVFTPAEHPVFCKQTLAVMHTTRSLFPDAEIVCSFHRGWQADEYTNAKNAQIASYLKDQAKQLGMDPWDVSGSVDGLLQYKDFDLHVGYRVHAHLKMLSMRKPSFLIAEDGRARGALEAMGLPVINAWQTPFPSRCLPHPFVRRVARIYLGKFLLNCDVVTQLKQLVTDEIHNDFIGFETAVTAIENTWPTMKEMISSLPA